MREEFEAARVTNLFGNGQSVDAARELSMQMQSLQQFGPVGMQRAQELLVATRADFNAAGFGQNIQDVPVTGAFGQRVGTSVYMVTEAGPEPIAQLMYQPGFQENCDSLGYGLAGMRVGGFGGRFGGAVDLRIGNFDVSLFGGGRPGFGLESPNYYAPQQGWQGGFQSYLGNQNLNYGQVQQSFHQYPVGTTTIINNETTVNNKTVNIDNSKPVSIGTINNINNSHQTTIGAINNRETTIGTINRPTTTENINSHPTTIGTINAQRTFNQKTVEAPTPTVAPVVPKTTWPGTTQLKPHAALPQEAATPLGTGNKQIFAPAPAPLVPHKLQPAAEVPQPNPNAAALAAEAQREATARAAAIKQQELAAQAKRTPVPQPLPAAPTPARTPAPVVRETAPAQVRQPLPQVHEAAPAQVRQPLPQATPHPAAAAEDPRKKKN
jgi:hypothetical protein